MNLERLENVMMVQSETYNQWRMFAYLIRQVKEIGCDFNVINGSIYITKGKANVYPCVVAHMDTVHNITSNLSIIKYGDKWTGFNVKTMTQTGIGGDDKVGIFIALECLREFDNIKVAFFRDEECGCEGSYEAYMPFFEDCGYVLQCDRRGDKDFVINASGVELSNSEFQWNIDWLLKDYGYSTTVGMMTDVMALKENGLAVCAANISCGYYNPHEDNEYININHVEKCLHLVRDIIYNLGETKFKHVYVKPKPKKQPISKQEKKMDVLLSMYKETYRAGNGRLARSAFNDTHKLEPMEYCECCSESVHKVTFIRDHQIDMCDKCIESYCPHLAKDNGFYTDNWR